MVDTAPELSVVIPTRDRADRLLETLDALLGERSGENGVGDFEILVIDDGSGPETLETVRDALAAPKRAGIRFEPRPTRGPAAARNTGVRLARGERVLFLGDDTRPAPGTLARHLGIASHWRRQHGDEVAIQGHIDWDPDREITPLMRFLAPAGPQFYFRGLADRQPIPYTAVLGSNLSAPRSWLLDEPFDEGFPHAAVEDTEMAWRWYARGFGAIYSAEAVCWHHHLYRQLEPFLARQRRAGASARHAVRLHPRLVWDLLLQPTLFGAIIRLRRLLGRGRQTDAWDLACRRAFLRGFCFGAGGDLTNARDRSARAPR